MYKRCKAMHDFARFKITQSFGDAIKNDVITKDMADDEQQKLAKELIQDQDNKISMSQHKYKTSTSNKYKTRTSQHKNKKKGIQNNALPHPKGRGMAFNANWIFSASRKIRGKIR